MTEDANRPTVHVETLTDEELSVLTGQGRSAVLPHLDALPAGQQEAARKAAYRSLVARGIVERPTDEALARSTQDGVVDLEVRSDIRAVISLRESAQAVVLVARATRSGQDFWYAHVVDDLLLLEEVSSDGLHEFSLADGPLLAELVVGAALHHSSTDGSGAPVPWTSRPDDRLAPAWILEQQGSEFLRSDVVVRHPSDPDPPALILFTGPAGVWCVDVEEENVDPVAEPMRVGDLESRLDRLVLRMRGHVAHSVAR